MGQSEDMYISRLFGVKPTVMLNAGFYIFDAETKAAILSNDGHNERPRHYGLSQSSNSPAIGFL